MKKLFISIIVIAIVLLSLGTTFAAETRSAMETNTASDLIEMQQETKTEMDEYTRSSHFRKSLKSVKKAPIKRKKPLAVS